MMFDVLVGVVIEGFRVSARGPDDETKSEAADHGQNGFLSADDEGDDGSSRGKLSFVIR